MKRKLVFLALCLCGAMSAMNHWIEYSADFITSEKNEIEAEEVFGSKLSYFGNGKFKDVHFQIGNKLFYRNDDTFEMNNAMQQNDFFLSAFWKQKNHQLSMSYRNRFFKDTELTLITGINEEIERKMVHNTAFNYKYNAEQFYIGAGTHFRNHSFEDLEEESVMDNDVYFYSNFGYRFLETGEVFTKVFVKHDLASSENYNVKGFEAGSKYYYKLTPFQAVSGEFMFRSEDSNNLIDCYNSQFIGKLRYNFVLMQKLGAFFEYQTHSAYDSDEEILYVMNNTFRTSLKYSFLADRVLDSFIRVGAKVNSIEDKTTYEAEARVGFTNNIYISSAFSMAEDFYMKSVSRLNFLIKNYKIWAQYEMKDIELKNQKVNTISIGTTLDL